MTGKKRQAIMLVDDNQANLNIGKNMLKDRYEVYALPSAERLFKFLETVKPDLILLDIAMPGMSGFDVIRILKADARQADIPVIFLTAKSEEMNELEGLTLGAVDYVTKPFSAAILSRRIENHLLIEKQRAELKSLNESLIGMVKEKADQLTGLQSSVINIIAELVEFRDVITGGHIYRTQKYVESLLNRLMDKGVYSDEILAWENMDYIVPSTQLHDLGKIFISDRILNKPGKLTEEEFQIMKTHAEKGAEAIRRMAKTGGERLFLKYAEIAAISHHEKWDGSGYPYGLKGQGIPLIGRLMAIADVYDALTQIRSYREPMPRQEAAKTIYDGSGRHFDPALIEAFEDAEEEFALTAKGGVS
ncbi:MAG: response regulator [Clostridiales bacterium]|jgi:putative two-component system response regulator|nr:response regulator [Clostridiales bacterium]